MQILAHRGLWRNESEKNTLSAFNAAFSQGFGIEIDFRDYKGNLVVAHDRADASAINADIIFQLARNFPACKLGINIKADGLYDLILEKINYYSISNYFVFDASTPDLFQYAKNEIKFYTRQSDIEPEPILFDKADGIWLDGFYSSQIDAKKISFYLYMQKHVCLVSPELHKRPYKHIWEEYKALAAKTYAGENLMICTDHPIEARSYFNETN